MRARPAAQCPCLRSESTYLSTGCCEDDLDSASLAANERRALIAVLLINVGTFAMMVAAARSSGSSALLSGTLDNLGDALTYALSLAVVGAATVTKARVALFKGAMITAAAIAVAVQIAWHLADPSVPIVGTMGGAALANFVANLVCLRILWPYREGDVNLASAWECSRNDVAEGIAVIATAGAVWLFRSPWPDLIVAIALLVLFTRSATRVLRRAWRDVHAVAGAPAAH
jgi:Co/Zn/Cd efflux system component